MNHYTHKILCKCDENKGLHSNKRGVYGAYISKNNLQLRCKTCHRKQTIRLQEGYVNDREARFKNNRDN